MSRVRLLLLLVLEIDLVAIEFGFFVVTKLENIDGEGLFVVAHG